MEDDIRHISFSFLLEGKIGNYSNLLQNIISNGVEAVTNDFTLLAWERKLPPAQNQITVTNINPTMDHLALLEFCRFSPNGNDLLHDVSSVSANATFVFSLRILINPSDQIVEEGNAGLFSARAVGTQPPLQKRFYRARQP
jgi:hypothetical protein